MPILSKYQNLKKQHLNSYNEVNKTYNLISFIRIFIAFIFLGFLYFFFKTDNSIFLWGMGIAFFLFFLVMKWHGKVYLKRIYFKTLNQINEDEINYIEYSKLPFNNGNEYQPKKHDYSFDLDFFGKKSLFQNLNRTASFIGEKSLANSLLTLLSNEKIVKNQEAIKELSKKIAFRQDILAYAKITNDNKSVYETLIDWSKKRNAVSKILFIISFFLPLIFIGSFALSFILPNPLFTNIATYVFIINLGVLASQYKKITYEISNLSDINEIIRNYGLIIEKIENESFKSEKLKDLQKKLKFNSLDASKQIKNLSSIFKQVESIQNPIGAVLVNGSLLYHLHSYRSLLKWKNSYAAQIDVWLGIIGEFESLNSFANFSFNNPKFCFPEINKDLKISFSDLGHPLINKNVRVSNNINFSNKPFIILTGSNMSGKSTFLRSLGVNIVLAGIGAPVCALKANVHPLNVLVSMRLSDSLEENESYFFAEVKRLKEIMTKLDQNVSFVLLDEILRGTNSDDKRSGTIAVIKKMISKKAIGAIATHDLEVCNTTNEFPRILTNKNFEVEIINDELVFDYKLREGICKNKSATFLMKKMEVI